MISWFSFFSAQFFISLTLLLVMVLCRWKGFLERYSVSTLILAAALAAVRVLLPLDMPFACVVEFWTALSAIQIFLASHPRVAHLLLGIWGVGVIAAAARDLAMVYSAHRRYQRYIYVSNRRVRRVAREVPPRCRLIVSPNVQVPFVRGAFRPIIYLPAMDLPEWELRLIVTHEVSHVLGHDAFVKLFCGLLSAVFWWNPVVRCFRREIDNLLEFRCDERVTETLGTEEQEAYLQMLLNMSKRMKSLEGMSRGLSMEEFSALGRASVTKRRFHVIFNRLDRPPRRVGAVFVVCILSIFFASYFVVFQFMYYPTADEFEKGPGVDYDLGELPEIIDTWRSDTYVIKRHDDRYMLYVDNKFVGYLSYDEVSHEEYQNILIFEEENG